MEIHEQKNIGREEVSAGNKKPEDGWPVLPEAEEQKAPPSSSSSPSHEFSFTVSLDSSLSSSSSSLGKPSLLRDRTKHGQAPFAIDLSPADEIFFHGHLLPLHLLSHLPVSPRTSTNSLENLSLPIKDFLLDQKTLQSNKTSNPKSDTNDVNSRGNGETSQKNPLDAENRARIKPKPFSLFNPPRWRKGLECKDGESEAAEAGKAKVKKKLTSDITHALKKYIRIVKPFLPFQKRDSSTRFRRQAQSFSTKANTSRNRARDFTGRNNQFSAPASIRTSPANSGHLLVKTGISSSSSSSSSAISDSTMEELEAAIQAAIAHCKNSIAFENKAPKG